MNMGIAKFFGQLACSRDRHKWGKTEEGDMVRSKAGLLAGTASLGRQLCQRNGCVATRDVIRASSMIRFCTDDTGWQPMTPQTRKLLDEHFVPLVGS